jgi:hypothetical protein
MRRIAYRQILIPDTVFDIERDETELLIAELRLTARTGAAYDAAGAADRLKQPNDGSPTTSPTRKPTRCCERSTTSTGAAN